MLNLFWPILCQTIIIQKLALDVTVSAFALLAFLALTINFEEEDRVHLLDVLLVRDLGNSVKHILYLAVEGRPGSPPGRKVSGT